MIRPRLLIVAGALAASLAGAADKQMTVFVENSPLRASPQPFGEVLVRIPRDAKVFVVQEQGAWSQVRTETGTMGWMAKSSLRAPHFNLSSGSTNARGAVSADEQATATKGFNSKVEADFKAGNPNLDFSVLDRMERMKVPEARMQEFLKAGELKGCGGAK